MGMFLDRTLDLGARCQSSQIGVFRDKHAAIDRSRVKPNTSANIRMD